MGLLRFIIMKLVALHLIHLPIEGIITDLKELAIDKKTIVFY